MTCKGYDPKSIKLTKPVKVMAAGIFNKDQRRAFIRDYAATVKTQMRTSRKTEKEA